MAFHYYHFVLSVFAAWRITHLISKEDGPFDLIYRIRKHIGQGFFAKLLDCFYCLSIWVAIPFGIWIGTTVVEKIVCIIAVSGAACIIQKIIENNKPNPPQYFET